MRKVIAELNDADTYKEQYEYLHAVLADITFENMLELLVLVDRHIDETPEDKETMLGVIRTALITLHYNQ